MNRHITLTENSASCCLIQAYFTVVPWQSTPLLFLTGRVPPLIERFLSLVALIHRKDDHRFARLCFSPWAGYIY
jgi:hypothetical protein